MMHEQVLPPRSADILSRIEAAADERFQGWTLAGGTGLALRIGHRLSQDFDFFRTDAFRPERMHDALRAIGAYETALEDAGSLAVLLGGVKLSFFKVLDPFLYEATTWRFTRIAAPMDIALMKLAAIAGRGARKDFIDLWFLLRDGSVDLRACLDQLPAKYGAARVNRLHILKSLAYFADAENEPMPRMLLPFDWPACRGYFEQAVRDLAAVRP
jgi:hypothetical protein